MEKTICFLYFVNKNSLLLTSDVQKYGAFMVTFGKEACFFGMLGKKFASRITSCPHRYRMATPLYFPPTKAFDLDTLVEYKNTS